MASLRYFGSSKMERKRTLWGYLFILPALLGLLIFYLGPMLYSLIISFSEWDIITMPKFVGIENYQTMFFKDDLIKKSLVVTAYYSLLAVPMINIVSLFLATLLNSKIKGLSVFRTIFYLPSIVPAVASAALWMFLCNPMFGFFNTMLGWFGIARQQWIYDSKQVIPVLAVMATWAAGNTVIIYLAGLLGIPNHLYEAVEVDGGNVFHKFFYITVPLMTPIIFFNVVMGVIQSMQTFTQGFIMTQGGPANASLFYVLHLYRNAFKHQKMGYASAMAWLLFIIIGILTFINFKLANKWVVKGEGE
ncbi:MAG: carbohydrate ABC transporter permease [bacterium]